MPNTIIFDMGGVLVDLLWDKLCSSLEVLSACEPETVRAETANGPIVMASMRGETGPVEFCETFTERLGISLTYTEFAGVWNGLLAPNEEIYPLVRELSPHYTMCLASNTDQIHFARAMDSCEAVHLFDRYYLSYEMGVLKPDPRFFQSVLADLGVPAAECVFIDDTPPNVASARKLGITSLLYQSVTSLRRDLRAIL